MAPPSPLPQAPIKNVGYFVSFTSEVTDQSCGRQCVAALFINKQLDFRPALKVA